MKHFSLSLSLSQVASPLTFSSHHHADCSVRLCSGELPDILLSYTASCLLSLVCGHEYTHYCALQSA